MIVFRVGHVCCFATPIPIRLRCNDEWGNL